MKVNCKQASRLISLGLDKELPLAERTALRFHLALCDACNKLKLQFQFMRQALAAYSRPPDEEDGKREP